MKAEREPLAFLVGFDGQRSAATSANTSRLKNEEMHRQDPSMLLSAQIHHVKREVD